MSFTNPNAFWLLLLIPYVVVVGWPRLGYRRQRDVGAMMIRVILVILLVLGLAGIQIERAADKLAVVFLIDVSDSVSPALQSAAVEYVRQASAAMGDQDQAAVIVFGADALVEIPISEQLELVQVGSDPIRLNTDLAKAIRLGMALYPADTAKRMVILSDGRQTAGDAEEAARLAAATDVQIDYVLLDGGESAQRFEGPEILVTDVSVPSTVNEGEEFDLTVTVDSSQRDSLAQVQVLASGQIIHTEDVVLKQGRNTYVFPDITVPSPGFVDFRVVVQPRSADSFYQNNELSAFTRVTGPPRVLLVTSDPAEVTALEAALTATGLNVDILGPRDLPLGLAPLSAYDTVVLANVSATDLSPSRMSYLQAYVRDLGGGLVAIGGPDSYGVGGYFDTPLEETLPVDMRLKDQERVPQLTMLFVLDRSGSMEVAGQSGVSNLELAKEAVARSLDLLNDTDRVGVLSFDINAYFVVEIQPVGDVVNRDQLRAQIGALRPGGGTNIRQGILSADEVLRDDPSQLKHIILLTDGGSDESGIAVAIDRMYQNYGITTSVVAVGQDYARWLEQAAVSGRGKFHVAVDVSTIPAIFTAETLLATRSYISEEPFVPVMAAEHPIIRNIDSLPELDGYVATTAKDTATVILRGPEDDPLLAAWQYGLGRAVAFTSDATSRWASDWVSWASYADFWNQALRWTIIEGSSGNIEARVEQRGERAVLVVEARNSRGGYLNGLDLTASLTNARLDALTLDLQQTAPGRYEAMFVPQQEGSYFITVSGGTAAGANVLVPEYVSQTTGWVLSYSAEYRVSVEPSASELSGTLLMRVSAATGGGALQQNPGDAFKHDLDQMQASRPLWHWFVLAALLLLPVDIAIRRLVVTRRDLTRLRQWMFGWVHRKDDLATDDRLETTRMGRLMDAKDRARPTRAADADQQSAVPPPRSSRSELAPVDRVDRQREKPSTGMSRSSKPVETQDDASLASRLLDRRRGQGNSDQGGHDEES